MVLQRSEARADRVIAPGFNCEGINYGIATQYAPRPSARPGVSIVKESTMVLQHSAEGAPHGVAVVSIVKESAMVLQRQRLAFVLDELEEFQL